MKIFARVAIMGLIAMPLAAQAQSDNAIYVSQVGNYSKVTILQEGERNRIGQSSSLPTVLGGANGTATITQTGADNVVSSSVRIRGGNNQLTVLQQGNRNAYDSGRTAGVRNTISLTQIGNDNATGTTIVGQNNTMSIRQEGRTNNVRLAAYGDGNTLTASSKGNGNTIRLRAQGSNNALSATQIGWSNTIAVNQTGNNATLSITQR